MMKNVLIISTSLRKNSNSDMLAQQFAQGAQAAGHQVEVISLLGKDIRFCIGCMACMNAPACAQKDDANAIVEKMGRADAICFATPVYYYEIAGQMKTLLDRANPLFSQDYSFRDIYLLTASAEEEDSASDGAVHALEGWIACFPKARLAGVVRGGGASAPGEMAQMTEKMTAAYKLGNRV